jgi:hypothetical protein
MFMGNARFPRAGVEIATTIDFEGLTLQRGELNAGISGEGYIDRRHPHTYLHELVGSWKHAAGANRVIAATFGKGFAPFGTDDPMSRPLVKYPANHHLAQIPERAIAIGAASYGPLALELASFNGDEPEGPSDLPNRSRLFDSWSSRVTARLKDVAEFQGSFAHVISPEVAAGGGLNQKKWSTSGRYESAGAYALVEFAHTQESEAGRDAFSYRSLLAEASITKPVVSIAARVEQTDRPEEDRLANLFRTPRPPTDLSINGRTRWTIATVNAAHDFTRAKTMISPFVEIARAHVSPLDRFSAFDPKGFYGSNVIWSLSAGLRVGVGMMSHRMGRYGAALVSLPMKMDGMKMDNMDMHVSER